MYARPGVVARARCRAARGGQTADAGTAICSAPRRHAAQGVPVGRRVIVAPSRLAARPPSAAPRARPSFSDSRQPYPTAADFGAAAAAAARRRRHTDLGGAARGGGAARPRRPRRGCASTSSASTCCRRWTAACSSSTSITFRCRFGVVLVAARRAGGGGARPRRAAPRDLGGALNGEYANAGYVVMPSARSDRRGPTPLRAEVDASARHELAKGGYL